MKTNKLMNGPRNAWSTYNLLIKSLILVALVLTGIQAPLQAQETKYTKPSWWFGAAVGANYNIYQGSTQQLNSNFTALSAFHDGKGIGVFAAPFMEYHNPDSRWGIMLQAGLDSRRGSFKSVLTPCNCPADLFTNLSYITLEPSLRLAPFKSNFYLFGGPRFAFNITKAFTYTQGINPAYPQQEVLPDVKGDISNVYKSLISMQIGAGYDIPISSQDRHTQFVISPFISFQPYFGQSPRSIETWSITTIRVGAAIKIGRGHKKPAPVVEVVQQVVIVAEPEVRFSVNSPKNTPAEPIVRETFPLLNYVFFNIGSSQIPDRYILLKKNKVKDFKANQIETQAPLDMSTRSAREMIVYYNVLNILGDRMGRYPNSTVTLVGSSNKSSKDGKQMAESVKLYLVDVFEIDSLRISTEGRIKPKNPSEQPGGRRELVLLHESDRRVSIESSSPELLMEFRTGPYSLLTPEEISAMHQAPIESYVTFNVEGANEAFSSWSLDIKDNDGNVQNFGPYTQDKVNISGKAIMNTKSEGDYKVTMIGNTKSGKKIMKESTVHIVQWQFPVKEESQRFGVLFEFNKSKVSPIYENYLTDNITSKIPKGATVIIKGYTDIIGGETHNKKLSMDRASEVKSVIENALTKAGRNDVKFELYGYGEDRSYSQFENKFPEERFYNRTAIVDIVPVSNVL